MSVAHPCFVGYPNVKFLRERSDERPPGVANHIPYPHAFFRVKEFLKALLKAILQQHASHDSNCRCHPLVKQLSPLEIADALRLQLEAFWLGEPPFHAPILDDDTMEWWINLERGNSPRSNVIAVICLVQVDIHNLMFNRCSQSEYSQFSSIRCLTSAQIQPSPG